MTVDFRYKGMGYVALAASDLERTTAFATETMALSPNGEGPDGERFFRCSSNHHDVVLYPSDEAGFVRAAWEMETQEDVEKAFHHFEKLGVNPKWIAEEQRMALGLTAGPVFRMREPTTGAQYEYYTKMKQHSAPLKYDHITKFKEFGHFGLVVPNCKETTEYMVENMGFLVSDFAGPHLANLLRPFPNSNHHSFAPIQHPSGQCTFHHLAFMVTEIDDIGKLYNRVKRNNSGIAFGIGRHPTSGSIHLYVYDPDYMVWEYTLGMEQFPEVGYREPRNMSAAPEDFDLWGAMPDPGFLEKGAKVFTGD